jgi:hypothetical protein
MAIITLLENLAEGMVTAEPVLNHLGQLLLGKGVALSARHLTVLKTWGIEKCLVEGGEAEITPEMNETVRKLALEQVKNRLRWEPGNSWEAEIIEIAVRQTARRCLEKGGEQG